MLELYDGKGMEVKYSIVRVCNFSHGEVTSIQVAILGVEWVLTEKGNHPGFSDYFSEGIPFGGLPEPFKLHFLWYKSHRMNYYNVCGRQNKE